MDSFNPTTSKVEDIILPPVNEDDGTGSSGSCVVCKEDTSLPPSTRTTAPAPVAAASLLEWLSFNPQRHYHNWHKHHSSWVLVDGGVADQWQHFTRLRQRAIILLTSTSSFA
ncbi:hypothetical protein B0H13DRAFT_1875739 [Mycena leptocephala]|nr:hypothetical protein B0H13DRAFT_1875739 [Mycena leptocephala]